MRGGQALVALEAVDLQAANAADVAAVRLDRAEVLLDLWRVPEAVAEITAVSNLLQGTEPQAQEGSCGEAVSEASVRALELGARAPRVEGNYTAAAERWGIALARRRSPSSRRTPPPWSVRSTSRARRSRSPETWTRWSGSISKR